MSCMTSVIVYILCDQFVGSPLPKTFLSAVRTGGPNRNRGMLHDQILF